MVPEESVRMSRPALLLCAAAFWLSGASALTYEILWQRRMYVIFEKIVAVAGGEPTNSEQQGIGDEEFCPWSIGPVL
jgi:hypothetical protein